MNQPDWMAGFRQDLPMPIGWRKGQTSISIDVICCPECASVQVSKRDNGKNHNGEKGEAYAWWECSMCRHRFRMVNRSPIKAYING